MAESFIVLLPQTPKIDMYICVIRTWTCINTQKTSLYITVIYILNIYRCNIYILCINIYVTYILQNPLLTWETKNSHQEKKYWN